MLSRTDISDCRHGGQRIVKWFRRWGTALAVAVAIISALGVGGYLFVETERATLQYKHRAAQKAEEYRERARVETQTRCFLVPGLENIAECSREEDEAARQGQHDEYDLQAQRETVAWTRAMGVAALIAMVAGIIGIGLVFLTFKATRRAADSATDTYKAFVNVERGRLVVAPLMIGHFAEHILSVQARITNIGKSGATILGTRYAMLEGVQFPSEFKAQVMANLPLQPGGMDVTMITLFDTNKWRETPFVGGYVEYATTLGTTHKAYFLTMVASSESSPIGFELAAHPYTDRESRKRFGWPEDT